MAPVHQPEQVQREVVEGHVAQVRAGVGEPDLGLRMVHDPGDGLLVGVADGGRPPQVVAELGLQVEERVDPVAAAPHGNLGEREADQRIVGALDDAGLGEIAVIRPALELVAPLLAEALPVHRVTQQVSPCARRQVQRLGAGTDLFDHRVLEAVGPEAERLGERLEAHIGPQIATGERHRPADDLERSGGRLGVEHRDDRHAERLATDARRDGHEEREVPSARQVGDALEHGVATTEYLAEEPVLLPVREHRRGGPAAVPIAVHLVPRERVDGEPEVPDVERLVEHRGHAVELGLRRRHRVVQRSAEAHHVRADRGVAEERDDVRAER